MPGQLLTPNALSMFLLFRLNFQKYTMRYLYGSENPIFKACDPIQSGAGGCGGEGWGVGGRRGDLDFSSD